MGRALLLCALAAATLCFAAPRVAAQATAADSAGVLLSAAQRLEAEGRRDAAAALLRYIMRHYAGTSAADEAETLLAGQAWRRDVGSGRGELMVWYTLYGAWLGVAVPAALGADDPEPYGVGLLIGAPIGFLVARAYADHNHLTSGQARVIDFGSQWGTWQGLGWHEVLDERGSDRGAWRAMVLGGLAGAAAAAVLARGREIPSGRATFAIHGGLWGTWYGVAGSVLADAEGDDGTLTWALVGGNIGLAAGALGGPRGMTSGRTWLITAGGVGGLAAGFGLDLLVQPEDDRTAILIPTVVSALGLVAAARWTRNFEEQEARHDDRGPGAALLNLDRGRLRLSVPLPAPALAGPAVPGTRRPLVWRVPLFELRH